MKKWTLRVIGTILALVVLALAFLIFRGGPFIRNTVNRYGPDMLGVPVSLQGAEFRPVRGIVRLKGLRIGNPEGFKTDSLMEVGQIEVFFSPSSLFTDTIVLHKILIEDPRITYERGLRKSNFEALIDNMPSSKSAEPPVAGTKPEAVAANPEAAKPGKKVVLDELTVTGGQFRMSLTAMQGVSAPIALTPVTLRGIGRDGDAPVLGTGQGVKLILGTIFKSVLAVVGGIGEGAVEGVGAAGSATVKGVKKAGQATAESARKLGAKLGLGGADGDPDSR